jgi:hypothetical protein
MVCDLRWFWVSAKASLEEMMLTHGADPLQGDSPGREVAIMGQGPGQTKEKP